MRLFIEAALEPSALDEIWAVGEQIRRGPGCPEHAIRWVKREAMHLTLRFLGEVDDVRLADVTAGLAELEGNGRLQLRAVEVGSFGGRRPRVIWVGLEHDRGFGHLQTLKQRLDHALGRRGFDFDGGAFRPHLTLGRVRRQATRVELAAIRAAVDAAPALDITAPVAQVALVQSTLLKVGPRYQRLALAEL